MSEWEGLERWAAVAMDALVEDIKRMEQPVRDAVDAAVAAMFAEPGEGS